MTLLSNYQVLDPCGDKLWNQNGHEKRLRSILGLYYRSFIHDFSKVVRSLFDLLKKEAFQEWDEPSHQALRSLRASYLCIMCLSSQSLTNPLRCIRMQVTFPLGEWWCKMNGPLHMIARGLMVVKEDGQFMRKELFVVVHCLKTWQHYLELHKTKV